MAGASRGAPRALLARLWPLALAGSLAALLLGPALAPGFVLTYDMVWVPDLGLGATSLGLGTGLPRAVPSDAVVAVLDEVVPAALLQKVVLLGALVGGAPAVARLCGGPVAARAVAVTLWVWNPFVVERLVLGAWPLLVAYAVLPWVLVHGRSWRAVGSRPAPATMAWLLLLVPLGSLSASAGLVTATALVASLLGARAGRGAWTRLAVVLAAAQAPWVVTGLLHARDAVPAVPGFEVFAPSAEGFGSPLVAALSWGGAWNTGVTPLSRLDGRGTGYLVLVLVLVATGLAHQVRSRRAGRDQHAVPGPPWTALALCWAVGYGVVVVTTLAPGPLEDLASVVPGLALLRDGSRLLALCVPLGAVLAGHGAAAVVARFGTRTATAPVGPVPGLVAVLVLLLAPLALLPDAAGGAGGRLVSVGYPEAYADLGDRVDASGGAGGAGGAGTAPPRGAVLVLPLGTYRAPVWNQGRPVLDPVPRLVRGDVVAGGGLVVSGTLLPGEDPREQQAVEALRLGPPARARAALARLGIGTVVVDTSAPGGVDALAALAPGRVQLVGAGARPAGPVVLALRPTTVRQVPLAWAVLAGAGWLVYALSVLLGAGALLVGAPGRARAAWRSRAGGAVSMSPPGSRRDPSP